jgi:hypothetical protein
MRLSFYYVLGALAIAGCTYEDPSQVDFDEVTATPVVPQGLRGACEATVLQWGYTQEQPPWTFVGFNEVTWRSADSGGMVHVPSAMAGDRLLVDATMGAELGSPFSGLPSAVRLVAVQEDVEQEVIGASALFSARGIVPMALSGVANVPKSGPVDLVLQGRVGAARDVLRLQGTVSIRVLQLHQASAP